MIRCFVFITFLFWFLVFNSCNRNVSTSELIEKFNGNKTYLDSLLVSLQHDKKLDSFFHDRLDKGLPSIENDYPKQFEIIKKVGLTEISSHPVCRRCPRWYYIKTNWLSEYPIYLIHNFSDSIENGSGFYKKDEYQNETWGLGGNWKMFRFVDTIRNIKY